MDHFQPTPLPDSRRVARALGAAGLMVVAITLALAGLLFSSYHSTIEREQTNLRNLATAYAAQAYYAMLALDTALARDADGTPAPAGTTVMRHTSARVYFLGPDGQRRPAGSAVRPGNDVPVPVRAPDSPPLVALGDPGRAGGRATITLARALPARGADGGSAGSIVIETDADYFQRIFASSDLGSGGSVTLLRRDGIMLVRSPTLPHAIGRSFLNTPLFQVQLPRAPVGAFEASSPIDGTRRLYGYSAVADYPLVIITGRDKADTLAVWRGWLWVGVLAWALLSATLALLAWRIGREASRQAALIARLETSEGRLTHSFRYLKSILDSLATPLWVLDAQRRIVLFNKAFQQFTGKPGGKLDGRPEADVLDPHGAEARERLYAAVAADGVHAREAEIRNGAGELRTALHLAARLESENHAAQIVNSLADITERKQVELRLAWLSDFDPLTGLPNQDRLRRTLGDAIEAARADGGQVVLILVALERLHEVADLLGHEAGDEAVRQVAARLGSLASQAMCPARVKANEFGLLLPAAATHRPVDDFAFELHALLSEPVRVREREFHLEPVIGIAVYPQDAGSVNELMRLADIAKHRARGEGGEPVHFHSESTHIQLNERLSIEEQLRRALERGELSLAYQPKVEIGSGRITGFEVLLRWHNPLLGQVSPARFIPIAEQTGLILPIGNWVLRSACAQASAWLREHGIQPRVAVNLSIRQFYQKDLLRTIEEALAGAGLAPDALELEITESIAMSRIDVVERLLAGIRALGVELSIDDFGTGYSSLAYLKRFPVQCLKIDRAFIRDLGRDADSAAIVRAIVALGHGLNMRIVAEGVETEVQLAMLRELGCDEYQGYLFARPLDAPAVTALLGGQAAQHASGLTPGLTP
jgi:diguanylate cyclase (GGDEF)-like protein/PAS domain S-box-containing protein